MLLGNLGKDVQSLPVYVSLFLMDNEMNHVKVPGCGECLAPIAAEKSLVHLNEDHILVLLVFLFC